MANLQYLDINIPHRVPVRGLGADSLRKQGRRGREVREKVSRRAGAARLAGGLRIAAVDVSDQAATQACFEVVRAAGETDDPLGPPWSLRRMRDWLAETEPSLERIVTGNAAANRHMIAINEELGYELLGPLAQNYQLAVAGVPA